MCVCIQVILSGCLFVTSKLFVSGDVNGQSRNLSQEAYKELCARLTKAQITFLPAKTNEVLPAKANRAGHLRYQTIMKSRVSATSLKPNEKVTLDLDSWLEIVLEYIFVYLKEQDVALMSIFQKYDIDGDGQMTWEEFLGLIQSISPDSSDSSLEVNARAAYNTMLRASATGVITPKVFANGWRTQYLALEKASLQAIAPHSHDQLQASNEDEGVGEGGGGGGGRVLTWERVEDEFSDLEWDLDQFHLEYALPADNVFSRAASKFMSQLRDHISQNNETALRVRGNTHTPATTQLIELEHAGMLLKEIKYARTKAQRQVPRFRNLLCVSRPGREERVQDLVQTAVFKFKSPVVYRQLQELRSNGMLNDSTSKVIRVHIQIHTYIHTYTHTHTHTHAHPHTRTHIPTHTLAHT